MDIKHFISSPDYQEFKEYMFEKFASKVSDVDALGFSDNQIAVEVRAHQLAEKKLAKGFRDFESQIAKDITAPQRFI